MSYFPFSGRHADSTTTHGTGGTSPVKYTAGVLPHVAFPGAEDIHIEEPGYSIPVPGYANGTKAPSFPDKSVREIDRYVCELPYSQVKDVTDSKSFPSDYATADVSRKSPLFVPMVDELGYTSADNDINVAAVDGAGYTRVDKSTRGATQTPAGVEGPYAVSLPLPTSR